MTTHSPSSTEQNGAQQPITAVHQSLQHQVAPSETAQPNLVSRTTRELSLQEADLLTPIADEAELPPPAYGDTYGEIRNEKGGLGTSAFVGYDGRVDIRINQLNQRLSQVFNPVLRNYVQDAGDARPLPPPYIPPALGGDERLSPPPSLNVVVQVVGSRGDVQPFVALGKVLRETYGHRVRLATHPNFKGFVQENGLEFFSIGGDPSQLMAFMVKNPGLMPGFRSIMSGDVRQRRKDVAEYIQGCWRSCYQAGDGINDNDSFRSAEPKPFVADCIIANPPSFAHIHCAEKLGIPLHIMFTMPYSPTQAFPHPLTNIQSSNADPQLTNYMSYAMIEILALQGLGDIINRFRKKCLDLEPVSRMWAPGMLHRLKIPHTYCWSPSLIPKPKDWGAHISISGFYFLDLASDYTPSNELQIFLDAGPPPVYIGFGSIVLDDPDAMTQLIFEAVKMTGQRVLLSKGWGGMGAGDKGLHIPDGVFMLGNVPHDWLFKRVSCVVHHGGAGTTAAGITAGRPTLIVPFFGDQPFWGAMIARAGAGPEPIHHKKLTAESLANAINFCLKPESLRRAKELASKIATEQGTHKGAQSFHQNLEPDRLRCLLVPSRVAVWRLRRTQVRLSSFAACTLANAKVLDFGDLKLFRAQEYEADEGPWDPVSGFAAAYFGAVGEMVGGLAEIPAETYRAARTPFNKNRAQSQSTKSSTVEDKLASTSRQEAAARTKSPTHNQTSLNEQHQINGQTAPDQSSLSSSASNLTPNVAHITSQGPKRRDSSTSVSRTSTDLGPSKNRDMMHGTSAHASKGFGRFAKAAIDSPLDLSMGIAKGFHNTPKLWGDDTVRPQPQVKDMKSGFQAIGKEFGYGMYDGITGIATQPWNGAKKDGASGFFKGVGKGLGGIVAKPGAALFSIPAYFMKGAYKQVESMFSSDVHGYIVASRTAQGYEDWLQSADAEKEDVIDRWNLIQRHLKKKDYPEEVLRDILEAHQKTKKGTTEASIDTTTSAPATTLSTHSTEPSLVDDGGAMPESTPDLSLNAHGKEASSSKPAQNKLHGGPKEHDENERSMQASVIEAQQRQHRTTNQVTEEEERLRQAIAASEQEAQRHAKQRADLERQLKLVTDRSQDPGHLAGTTRSEFEAQQPQEKTAEERIEEEIVLAYVKKQSLLEVAHHEGKGKGRMKAPDSAD